MHDAVLLWFRRDLRLSDHAALWHALSEGRRVYCAFVFDTDILDRLTDRADRRVEFIHASVAALKAGLEAHGSTLWIRHGAAQAVVPALAAELGVTAVYANRDYEPSARMRDVAVSAALAERGCRFELFKDQVIFEAGEVLTGSGQPYRVFTPYKRAWLARLQAGDLAPYSVETRFDRLAPSPSGEGAMPGLDALGFARTNLADLGIVAGEAGAQARWQDFRSRLDRYRETRDFPAVKGPSYLSVHLRFGTISVRELARHAHAQSGEGAAVWLSELIWREFYQMLLWHHPATVDHAFQTAFDAIAWPNPPGHFEAWCAARTGYPIIDAALRQLNQTGYMHNRLRMIAASFLVKDLHVDWRLGERYFAARLLDYDQAANIGGWQWSASTGTDAQPWFRIFNPVTQSEKFDPGGKFIRRYLPELADLPDRFIHAPWTMPDATRAALDYPPPIVDHARARLLTLDLFKAAAQS